MIALLGGTFDPVHLGHLHAARRAAEHLEVDCVSLVLSARPSHRDSPATSVADRWEMLRCAVASEPLLEADDSELRRVGPSYTVETLQAMRRRVGSVESITWILGWDAYRLLPTWHRWREVLNLTHLLIVRRPGQNAPLDEEMMAFDAAHATDELAHLHRDAAGFVMHLADPMLSMSSTAIRTALARGEDVRHLLPAAVWSYIKERHLYGGTPA